MPSARNEHLQDAAVLTRAVENLFRKLIRFLIGRISLVKLQEMIRYIFVEEAENKLKKENPTKNISLTKLALLSGIDTRTLTKVRNSDGYRQPLYRESKFLREFTPGAAILDFWCSRKPFIEPRSGKPKTLKISGKDSSFEALFAGCIKGRGITANSLLQRLAESGAVEIDQEQETVKLLKPTYLPSSSRDQQGSIQMGFSAIGNMLDTVIHNVESLDTGEDRLYQQGAWTYRLSPANREEARQNVRELLANTDAKARKIFSRFEDKNTAPEQITSGISLFYFEESGSTQI
jgi:hypothetical protein